jgi:hypothetical protein
MAYEHKDGTGTMFCNNYKKDGDKTPDFKGSFKTPDGTLLEIAAWFTKGAGDKSDKFSLKIQPPRPPKEQAQGDVPRSSNPASKFAPKNEPEIDSVPF